MVIVGNAPITGEDVEWEYRLLTQGLIGDENLTAIPEVGDIEQQLAPLREKLVANLIERKLLYQFIKQDQDFTIDNPSRYTGCLKEWQKTLNEGSDYFATKQDKERLKNRLCERQIIIQYLDEKVFAKISVPNKDIEKFYNQNLERFSTPPRIDTPNSSGF